MVPVDGWQWPIYIEAMVSGNQTGKTLLIAIIILWANTYKIGVDRADQMAWLRSPYAWYHLGPDQNTSYLPLRDIRLILDSSHPAQYDKEQGTYRKCLLPAQIVKFTKIETYYEGLEFLNGAVVQFRTTDEKAKALQGRRAWGITYDECAYEDHLKSVIDDTLIMRLVTTGGPLILVSTPNGMNDWFEVVEDIKDQAHPTLDDRVWVTEDVVDGRKNVLVYATTYDNVGYGVSQAQVDLRENTMDAQAKDRALYGAFLEPEEAFFVPAANILTSFRKDLRLGDDPVANRPYVIFWDPSAASDPSAGYVLDVSSKPWKVVAEMYEQRPRGIHSLISEMIGVHTKYTMAKARAITGYDATGMGGKIVKQLLGDLRPSRPMDFSGTSKLKTDVFGNLRAALLSGDLLIPDSLTGLKREVLNYKLDDKKIRQDRVFALAGAAWIASKGFGGNTSASFSPHAMASRGLWR